MMDYSQNANNENKSKRKKRRKRKNIVVTIIFRVFIILFIVGCFAAGGAFLGAYMGIIEDTPTLNASDAVPESYTSILYDANGNEVDRLHGEENREYVKLTSIPLDLRRAVIAIEDERFYSHNGVDIKGMFRALWVNIREQDTSQGASTITQQLMKNEVLTTEQTITRKLKEQYLAVSFEKELISTLGTKRKAKDYILELYLNTIALNHGLNGVQAASLYYFGKDVSELSLAESASIAGITKNPSAYSPISNPTKNKERQTLVLDKMLELEFITQSEYNTAMAEDIYANLVGKTTANTSEVANHNYFIDSAIVALADQLQEEKQMSRQQAYNTIYSGGLKIYLTMDSSMQSTMEESFKNDSLFPPKASGYTVTYTLSVMDNATEVQSHYERSKKISNESEADAFVEAVKSELVGSNETIVADKVNISKSLQAAMTIMDYRTGGVKAIVGGREKDGDLVFNRATQALRQPGSCFKVL
ncbi:MAG: transglycosylase domain-containing protein, partial [Anaerotignaceae bacterium]